jgi:hypothetical protein
MGGRISELTFYALELIACQPSVRNPGCDQNLRTEPTCMLSARNHRTNEVLAVFWPFYGLMAPRQQQVGLATVFHREISKEGFRLHGTQLFTLLIDYLKTEFLPF